MNNYENAYTHGASTPMLQTEYGQVPQANYGQAPLMPGGYPQQTPSAYASSYKQPSGWGKLWAALGLAFAVLIIQTIGLLLGFATRHNEAMLTIGEITGGVAAVVFVWALGGKKLATPSLQGLKDTWHIVKWIFIVDAIIAVIDMFSVIADGSFQLAQLWPLRVLLLLIMCAGIGLFEEATFRGLVFHGLLARMGINYKGIFWAVIISSLVFGLMHIDPFGMNWADPSQVLQAILKVAQTAIFGFAAAAAVLKTGNLWPVALFHGLNDFILMFVSNGLMPSPITTEYVTEGTDGLIAIGIYLVLCTAYIPSIVLALRTLKEHATPDRGQFYKPRYYPPTYTSAPVYTYPSQASYSVQGGYAIQPTYPAQAAYPAQAYPTQTYPTAQTYPNQAYSAQPYSTYAQPMAAPAGYSTYEQPVIAQHPPQ